MHLGNTNVPASVTAGVIPAANRAALSARFGSARVARSVPHTHDATVPATPTKYVAPTTFGTSSMYPHSDIFAVRIPIATAHAGYSCPVANRHASPCSVHDRSRLSYDTPNCVAHNRSATLTSSVSASARTAPLDRPASTSDVPR